MTPLFDAAIHEYRHPVTEERLPSVTQILAAGKSWEYGQRHERARQWGVSVHQMVALDSLGRLDHESLADELKAVLEQWHEALRMTGMRVVASELPLYHPVLDYAGTVDCLVTVKGMNAVLDIKTGHITMDHEAQVGGYIQLFNSWYPSASYRAHYGYVLQLREGKVKLQKHDAKTALWAWQKRLEDYKRGNFGNGDNYSEPGDEQRVGDGASYDGCNACGR